MVRNWHTGVFSAKAWLQVDTPNNANWWPCCVVVVSLFPVTSKSLGLTAVQVDGFGCQIVPIMPTGEQLRCNEAQWKCNWNYCYNTKLRGKTNWNECWNSLEEVRTFTKAHFSHQCIFSRVYFLSPLPSCLLCLRITSMSADPQNTSDGREDLNGRHMVQLQNAQKGFIDHKKSVFFWKMLSGAHFAPHSPFPNYNLNIENAQKWRLPLELKLDFCWQLFVFGKALMKGEMVAATPFQFIKSKVSK